MGLGLYDSYWWDKSNWTKYSDDWVKNLEYMRAHKTIIDIWYSIIWLWLLIIRLLVYLSSKWGWLRLSKISRGSCAVRTSAIPYVTNNMVHDYYYKFHYYHNSLLVIIFRSNARYTASEGNPNIYLYLHFTLFATSKAVITTHILSKAAQIFDLVYNVMGSIFFCESGFAMGSSTSTAHSK